MNNVYKTVNFKLMGSGITSIQNLFTLSTCLTYNSRNIVVDEKPAEKTILLKNNVQAK